MSSLLLIALASATGAVGPTPASAAPSGYELAEVVITAQRMREPLVSVADAKAPRQPLPAHDGADYLKTVPGFAVIRKGGADGDPVFRGMAASRVNIDVDGEQLLGGCGMRMDPPTAYIFPESVDRIVVTKGPQTVLKGPGNSAASVSFETRAADYLQPDVSAHASVLGASFGRSDLVGDLRAGAPRYFGQLTATRAASDDYDDGSGRAVHSAYERWSSRAVFGWTPSDAVVLQLSAARSDGEAAYADRSMDGVRFARDNVGLRAEWNRAQSRLPRVEAQVYYNYVDHVMDNFSLRDFVPTAMMPNRAVSNPDRRTTGARVEVDLVLGTKMDATLGVEHQANRHMLRSTMNETMLPYASLVRNEDARFRSDGIYGEFRYRSSPRNRIVAGLRVDDWTARDSRRMLSLGMTMVPNPTAGQRRDALLSGGFGRFEHELAKSPATAYVGIGRVERFPDYWELVSAGKETRTGLSAFGIRPEKTTQLDAGVVIRGARAEVSLSLFASDIDDYILIESNYAKGMRRATVVDNVAARSWGGEADATLRFGEHWRATGTLAYTRGQNRSAGTPLAQMPPLEARIAVEHVGPVWSAGALLRAVAAQDRVVVNQGNIVGQDIGPSAGFAVLSVNAGWKPRAGWLVSLGVDNLLDRDYAEHLSRAGATLAGFERTTRVNEPGRTAWLKLTAEML